MRSGMSMNFVHLCVMCINSVHQVLLEHGGVLLVHEPEGYHLNTPFHVAAKMGWTQVIEVDIYMCNISFMKVVQAC